MLLSYSKTSLCPDAVFTKNRLLVYSDNLRILPFRTVLRTNPQASSTSNTDSLFICTSFDLYEYTAIVVCRLLFTEKGDCINDAVE